MKRDARRLAHLCQRNYLANAFRLPRVRREEQRLREHVQQVITLLDLDSVAETAVADLPFGTQKRVELARA